jgi:hypothetical protein
MAKKAVKKAAKASAKTFFEKLGAGGGAAHVFTGMIKPADNDDTIIMFARPGDCSKWVAIPEGQVEDVKLLHMVHCQDHTHPLVQVFMKGPSSPESKTFAGLAQLHSTPVQSTIAAVAHPHFAGMAASAIGGPGSTPCYWDWTQQRWVCP